jgi:hypothetical protein
MRSYVTRRQQRGELADTATANRVIQNVRQYDKGKGKGKGKFHPGTDHKGREGSRGIALLFL